MKTTRQLMDSVLAAFEADLPRMLERTCAEDQVATFSALAAEISESASPEDRDYVWERLRRMRIEVVRGLRRQGYG